MSATKKGLDIFPAQMGYDTETKRYWCMMYVVAGEKDVYVQCSCSGMKEEEVMDYAVEFLDTHKLNTYNQPYLQKIFEEIENASFEMFLEMFTDEKVVASSR